MKFDVQAFMNGGMIQNADNVKYSSSVGYSNIKFEGLMCSNHDAESGDTAFFTIDPVDGKALKAFTAPQPYPLAFEVADIHKNTNKTRYGATTKPDVVTVVRHFRRWDDDLDQIASSGGMTAIVKLNYVTKQMTVYPAFCSNEDNFIKTIGLKYAKESEAMDTGIICDFNPQKSIRYNLIQSLKFSIFEFTAGTVKCDMKKLKRFFDNFMDYLE